MRRHTIDDVAALARVSTKTVSRVMNNEPHVRSEMRARVQDAITSLHYKPNIAARALAGSRAYLIALCYEDFFADYVSGMQLGVMKLCQDAGYHLVVEQLDSSNARYRQQLAELLSSVRMDGVILLPPACDRRDALDLLDEQNMPYVRVGPTSELKRSPYVYIDDQGAAYKLTAYLQSLGHSEIGFIKGHPLHASGAARYRGYRAAMRDAKIPIPAEWIQPGKFTFASGMVAAEKLLRSRKRPTAIFASNDNMAFGVIAAAHRLRIRIPDELSVVGFDDLPFGEVVWPPLTTIRQPIMDMAIKAAGMLINKARSSDAPLGHEMKFDLVVRESSGPPSRKAARKPYA